MKINYETKYEDWMDDLIWVTVKVKDGDLEPQLIVSEGLVELMTKADFK